MERKAYPFDRICRMAHSLRVFLTKGPYAEAKGRNSLQQGILKSAMLFKMPCNHTRKQILVFFLSITILVLCMGQDAASGGSAAVVPLSLIRPIRDEVLFYPSDAVIGELGLGLADSAAYAYARIVLNEMMKKNEGSAYLAPVGEVTRQKIFEDITATEPRKFRLGGGKITADGDTSFLFRFIGRENEFVGELYLTFADEKWKTVDILFEDVQAVNNGNNKYTFIPYAAFY